MSVRLTESRLPAGYRPTDLGEAVAVAGSAGAESYVLVSSLTSPVAITSTIDYAVFVTTGEDVDSYEWLIETIATGTTHNATTEIGVHRFMPVHPGLHVVSVAVNRRASSTVVLSMIQEVRPRFAGFEFMFDDGGIARQVGAEPPLGAPGGDPAATDELANDFRTYVLDAAAATDLPARFLAAFAYHGCTQAPKFATFPQTAWTPGRDQKLDLAASELNGDWNLVTDLDDRLGVCQLAPPTMATVTGAQGAAGTPYVTWRERAADGSDASAIDDATWTDFDALPAESKIDVFNLVRFPKSNIRLCADLLAALRQRPHRWINVTAGALLADGAALLTLASEFDAGANARARPANLAAAQASSTRTGRSIRVLMDLPVLAVLFPDSLQAGAENYGGHDLHRDDDGEIVRRLQEDLVELGFAVRKVPDEFFDRDIEWAVRELQSYAKSRYLAIEDTSNDPRYLARLAPALNLYHYSGPISGVVDVGTRVLIGVWKSKRWRCPVVVEAWDTDLATINDSRTVPSRTQPAAGFGNLWRHDEATVTRPGDADSRLMFVRDFSGHYELSPARQQDFTDADDLIDLGCFYPDGPLTRPTYRFEGRRVYPSVWPEAEILPETLVGSAALDPAQLATFKVVRAVAEMECLGFFDSVNCWDTAFVSMGPAHWTLGLSRPAMGEGELCGYLAYFSAFEPAAFHHAFERFGLRIDGQWVDATGDQSGRGVFDADERKYRSWVALQGEDGTYSRQYFDEDDANYFRTWHWAYRFVMAGRTVEAFQRRMWHMARIRLRDVRTAPLPAAVGVADVPDDSGAMRPAQIGDCFTSEKAVAMLHRWHIYQPFDICSGGEAGPRVTAAIAAAGLPGQAGTPRMWGQPEEDALITALRNEVNNANPRVVADLTRAITAVMNWPNYTGRPSGFQLDPTIPALSEQRDSFRTNFDASDLPPAP